MLGELIRTVVNLAGSTPVFLAATALCVGWLTGLVKTSGVFQPSGLDGICTFWLGFAILNEQKSNQRALFVYLKEAIRAIPDARNDLVGVEKRTEAEIRALDEE